MIHMTWDFAKHTCQQFAPCWVAFFVTAQMHHFVVYLVFHKKKGSNYYGLENIIWCQGLVIHVRFAETPCEERMIIQTLAAASSSFRRRASQTNVSAKRCLCFVYILLATSKFFTSIVFLWIKLKSTSLMN